MKISVKAPLSDIVLSDADNDTEALTCRSGTVASMKVVASIIVSLTILFLLIYGYVHQTSVDQNQKRMQIEVMIANHLPLGMQQDNVVRFLRSQKIECSSSSNQVLAIIRNTSTEWFFQKDVQIKFQFDKEKKLTSYRVVNVITGP